MKSEIELSPRQKSIVFAENSPIYVKARAGSGKTRVLTERVRYLLGKTPKKILALTFTNKAGDEIRERLRDIPNFRKRVFVGTFHGFSQYILENHGSLIGLGKMPHIFEDEADRLELIEQSIKETPSLWSIYNTHSGNEKKKFCFRILNFISEMKRNLIDDEDIKLQHSDENLSLVYQNYQDILNTQNAIDFDDLLKYAYSLFIAHPRAAEMYRRSFFAVCIDEAQDLNMAQYQLLVALAGEELENIMMVGDPNQSIFHFNGSSPDYMDQSFVNDFNPAIVELTENFRSSKAVLSAAGKVIPNGEDLTNTAKHGIFELHGFDDEITEAIWVIERIKQLVQMGNHRDIEGKIILEKIAVLARNRYLFEPLEKRLSDAILPFYYKMNPGNVQFESDLMKLFDFALRVRLNPRDNLHKLKLLSRLNIKPDRNNHTLESMLPDIKDDLIRQLISLIIKIEDTGSNLKQMLETFRDKLKLTDENEKHMVFNDINSLITHWNHYARKTDHKSLHQFKNAMALGQTHPLSQHSGITLSTVHTMKGQEFDIVFVIGLDDETFPDYRAVRKGGIDMIQEKNNLYVAFTRAKRFLYATWPQKRKMPWGDTKNRRKSRFLNALT
jgi:DNA helicase II / ATP-dependent DNA helicase PcrA